MLANQREKDKAVYDTVKKYQTEGLNKSAAVRQTRIDFGYFTEAAVYGVLKREEKRRKEVCDDDRPS